jgi:hypothetical protein
MAEITKTFKKEAIWKSLYMANGEMFTSGQSDCNLYMLSRTGPDDDEHGRSYTDEPVYTNNTAAKYFFDFRSVGVPSANRRRR